MLLEPALGLLASRVMAVDHGPECAAVIEMGQMGQFVHYHIASDGLWHHDQAPVEHDPSLFRTTAPSCSCRATGKARDSACHACCFMGELGRQDQACLMFQKQNRSITETRQRAV